MNKINSLKQIISKKKASALFLDYKHPNHRWLLGKKLENSLIIIRKTSKPILMKTQLEYFRSSKFKIINLEKRKHLQEEIKKMKIKKLCVDFSKFTLSQKKAFSRTRFIDVHDELAQLRVIKEKNEMDKLRKANKLTAICFNELIKTWKRKRFKHEKEILIFIRKFELENNCELSFDSIVATGINASVPHHSEPTKINKGFCVLDFGFDYEGYKADMTRTIYVGKPSKKDVELYNEMLEIQKQLISMSLPKTKAKDLDKSARIAMGKNAKYFTHGLGHGTGLEIHELPNLSPNSNDVIETNSVITIEPGIYIRKKKLGIRIEDSILVRQGKPEVLTKKATKKLIRI